MPRAQGFARGDFDTSFPIDDKFLALRHAVDPDRYYAAAGVYWHVVAAAWREVERKPAGRICPDANDEIVDLVSVGLLDSEERLPNRAFVAYVGRAKRQRAKTSERQRQHRTEKLRVSHEVSRVTERDSQVVTVSHNPAREQGEVGAGNEEPTSTGDARDDDPADTYWMLTTRFPKESALTWIDGMTAQYGAAAVNDAIATAYIKDKSTATLLGRAQDQLRSGARELDRKEKAEEQARLKEKRAQPRVEEEWRAEYRASIERQYRGEAA